MVLGAGDRAEHVYFLTTGIVSRLYVTQNGASGELAMTGSEGVIGVASFLGGESTTSQASQDGYKGRHQRRAAAGAVDRFAMVAHGCTGDDSRGVSGVY